MQLLVERGDLILGREELLLKTRALLDPLGLVEIPATAFLGAQCLLHHEQFALEPLDLFLEASDLGGGFRGRLWLGGGSSGCQDGYARTARRRLGGCLGGHGFGGSHVAVIPGFHCLLSLGRGGCVRFPLKARHSVAGFLKTVFHDGLLP